MASMVSGTVKWFNDAKGYGFISRAADGRDVFVHYSSIAGEGFRTLIQGQEVNYEENEGPKGLFALQVTRADGLPAVAGPGPSPSPSKSRPQQQEQVHQQVA